MGFRRRPSKETNTSVKHDCYLSHGACNNTSSEGVNVRTVSDTAKISCLIQDINTGNIFWDWSLHWHSHMHDRVGAEAVPEKESGALAGGHVHKGFAVSTEQPCATTCAKKSWCETIPIYHTQCHDYSFYLLPLPLVHSNKAACSIWSEHLTIPPLHHLRR